MEFKAKYRCVGVGKTEDRMVIDVLNLDYFGVSIAAAANFASRPGKSAYLTHNGMITKVVKGTVETTNALHNTVPMIYEKDDSDE